jgi:hypothetical protein
MKLKTNDQRLGGLDPCGRPNWEIVSLRSCVRARACKINGGLAVAVCGLSAAAAAPPRLCGCFAFCFLFFAVCFLLFACCFFILCVLLFEFCCLLFVFCFLIFVLFILFSALLFLLFAVCFFVFVFFVYCVLFFNFCFFAFCFLLFGCLLCLLVFSCYLPVSKFLPVKTPNHLLTLVGAVAGG